MLNKVRLNRNLLKQSALIHVLAHKTHTVQDNDDISQSYETNDHFHRVDMLKGRAGFQIELKI